MQGAFYRRIVWGSALFLCSISQAETSYRSWDGVQRTLPADLSVADLRRERENIHAANGNIFHLEGLRPWTGFPKLEPQYFSYDLEDRVEKLRKFLGRDIPESEITMSMLGKLREEVEALFARRNQLVADRPSAGSRDKSVEMRKEIESLNSRLGRFQEGADGLGLWDDLNDFAEDVEKYHKKVVETLAPELARNNGISISAAGKFAIAEQLSEDPELASRFQKKFFDAQGRLNIASGDALELFLAAGKHLARHSNPPRRQAEWHLPRPLPSKYGPMLEQLSKEYGIKINPMLLEAGETKGARVRPESSGEKMFIGRDEPEIGRLPLGGCRYEALRGESRN